VHPNMCIGARDFRIYVDGKEVGPTQDFQTATVEHTCATWKQTTMPQIAPEIAFRCSLKLSCEVEVIERGEAIRRGVLPQAKRQSQRLFVTLGSSRRVAHLAIYGRTERVRKKNRKRIAKEVWTRRSVRG